MQVLQTIMQDKFFRHRARAFVNGKFLSENHVWHCALSLGSDISNTYGAVTMMLQGHIVAATFPEEDGYFAIGRGPKPETPKGLEEVIAASLGNGYVVLYKGKIEAINGAMARLSEAANPEQQAQDTPLLH